MFNDDATVKHLPKEIIDLLYVKPGIGSCARRRLRRKLGIGRSKYGNIRRKLRVLRQIAFDRQGGRCYYCDVVMVMPKKGAMYPNTATADHLLPKAAGGADVEHNIVAACQSCNNAKGDKDLVEFVNVANKNGRDK